ncbi:MAG: repressor LexA [Parcubacteria group bacterium]|nr:repressor LexA [Parcubacteria group bacterium]
MDKQTILNPKHIKAIRHIRNWLVHNGRTPSVRELMVNLGYKSPKSAQDILSDLKDLGVIKKMESGNYKLISNPDLGPVHAQTVSIPLIGEISCGEPILADQNIEGYIPVSASFIKPGFQYYLLRAKGTSMDRAGINNEDLVLVRQQSIVDEGDKVVALIDDEATIKYFHKSKNAIILRPKSSDTRHKPIILTDDFQIQGVVVRVISDSGL